MKKELCDWCKKPMENSLNKIDKIQVHVKCKKSYVNEKEKTNLWKCPLCNKGIDYVRVISNCWQKATLKEGTNQIDEYSEVKDIFDTTLIECPECNEDITKYIEE